MWLNATDGFKQSIVESIVIYIILYKLGMKPPRAWHSLIPELQNRMRKRIIQNADIVTVIDILVLADEGSA